jgi:hypothetical protein
MHAWTQLQGSQNDVTRGWEHYGRSHHLFELRPLPRAPLPSSGGSPPVHFAAKRKKNTYLETCHKTRPSALKVLWRCSTPQRSVCSNRQLPHSFKAPSKSCLAGHIDAALPKGSKPFPSHPHDFRRFFFVLQKQKLNALRRN